MKIIKAQIRHGNGYVNATVMRDRLPCIFHRPRTRSRRRSLDHHDQSQRAVGLKVPNHIYDYCFRALKQQEKNPVKSSNRFRLRTPQIVVDLIRFSFYPNNEGQN